jgi:hypothetical protein
MVQVSISPTNFLWLPLSFITSNFELHLHFTSIKVSISIWHFKFRSSFLSFDFVEVQVLMRSGRICPLVIYHKSCITSSYSNWENAALVYTQWCLMITFMLSNNLHCINITCKVVHLVMDLIGMNCCWGRPNGRLVVDVVNYTSRPSFTNHISHLKG